MRKSIKCICNIFVLFCVASLSAQTLSTEQRVEELLKQMTLEEKIGQLNQYTGDRLQTGPRAISIDKKAEIRAGNVGSMLNVIGASTIRMMQEEAMKSRLKIPLLFALDVIHGYRVTFPIPLAESASWDLDAIEKAARIAGKEAAAAGQHWTFAPMVDVTRDPRWGRVMEGAGEDTYLGSLIAAARVKGFQGEGGIDGVMACAKHFAAYGAAQAGRDYHTTDVSNRTLWETYLPPFKAAVDAGVKTFMTGFNDLNGIPATGNQYLLREILRNKWNFQGAVVSDWGAIGEMIAHGFCTDGAEAAQKALKAGCDIDMESRCYISNLKKLVEKGIVSQAEIDNAVRRVLTLKFKLGLFEDPFRFCHEEREKAVLNHPEHHAFAKEMAEKSIVLLKNEQSILPLKKQKKIALIGPLVKSKTDMKGFWAIDWDDNELVSLYEGLIKRVPNGTSISYAKGCDINSNDTSGFSEAIELAKESDIVIMAVGESFDMSGEAKSRSDISLPGVQEKLIKAVKTTGKPVVVLIMAGRPLVFEWTATHADAILYTWWLGSEAGNAIASVLYGDYNPSGKLTMTFPRSVGQIPIHYNMKNTGRPAPDQDNISYGSAYLDIPNSPRYAFGYGLSYTDFTYSDLKLSTRNLKQGDNVEVTCTITNTGKYAGEEIVQLYLRDISASVTRPVKELKGFKKIMLQPGESTQVSFNIGMQELTFYGVDMRPIVEPGEFKLMIGSSSDNILLETTFNLLKL
ncbi:glycoside hydrolase family 3 N-terminal domain-containing protein [Phocaeicola coprocola]|uniref:glycoside hydrolase family 3 N-terminal domain-containing protein n=1 Tax=Phocaeicola coprocola TaxID=310298 RepID=UPI00267024B7|nr:glycoside hydrolase family 3 N-terminal domain-containing protein [Phocaeicola coprocola]